MQSDSPGVRVFPPAYYLAALAGGWALGRVLPMPWRVSGVAVTAGQWLLAAGFALAAWSFTSFLRAGTDPRPNRASGVLFTGGPFRYTRNPMYLGGAFACAGIALWTGWLWSIALLPAAVYGLNRFVIRREEAYMERTFGAAYKAYRLRVRRWL